MQVSGRMVSESLLFQVGNMYQQKTDWHTKKPEGTV